MENLVVEEIVSLSSNKVAQILLMDEVYHSVTKIADSPLLQMEGSKRSMPVYSLSLDKKKLKFRKSAAQTAKMVTDEIHFPSSTALICNFFMSTNNNIYTKDAPVMITMSEFEDAPQERQEECIEIIRTRYDIMFHEIDVHDSWFRVCVYWSIKKYCLLNDIDISIICRDFDTMKGLDFTHRNAILEFANDMDISEKLLKYYVNTHDYIKPEIRNEWINSNFEQIGDSICTICLKSFCPHIQTGLVQRRSTWRPAVPEKVCGTTCYLLEVLEIEVGRHFEDHIEFTQQEVLQILERTNSPCFTSQITGVACYVVYTIAANNKYQLQEPSEQPHVEILDVDVTGKFEYAFSTLMRPCIKGRQDHPSLLCNINCNGPYIKLSGGCDCIDKCETNDCPCFDKFKECDPNRCGCCNDKHKGFGSFNCHNLGLTLRHKKKLFVKKSIIHNYGLFTKENISRGDLIGEYCGELISEKECERREPVCDLLFLNYMFDLTKGFIIDAHYIGNELRFANHDERNYNCIPRVMLLASGEPKIGLYAKDDILANQELFFDYGKNYTKHLQVNK